MEMAYNDFNQAIKEAADNLLSQGKSVNTTSWQGRADPNFNTLELINYSITCPIPPDVDNLRKQISPNLPWVDNHFAERIGGEPLNPGEEYKNWPYYKKDEFRTEGEKFTHTYMERFWAPHKPGIRYAWGNLDDVINLLTRDPFTRQATFPIFFPEDTGAVHGGRIPCTLHYHFLCREGKLNIFYSIRSCDLLRHFQDDIYLACRLLIWVLDMVYLQSDTSGRLFWKQITPGNLMMNIYSLHVFVEDISVLKYRRKLDGHQEIPIR